jgi:hypothetical protein
MISPRIRLPLLTYLVRQSIEYFMADVLKAEMARTDFDNRIPHHISNLSYIRQPTVNYCG